MDIRHILPSTDILKDSAEQPREHHTQILGSRVLRTSTSYIYRRHLRLEKRNIASRAMREEQAGHRDGKSIAPKSLSLPSAMTSLSQCDFQKGDPAHQNCSIDLLAFHKLVERQSISAFRLRYHALYGAHVKSPDMHISLVLSQNWASSQPVWCLSKEKGRVC